VAPLPTVQSASQALPAGYIAWVDNTYNVRVYGGEMQEPVRLTQDGGVLRRYQFPTWSNDGRLAFFCCDTAYSPTAGVEVYVASPDLTAAKLLYQAVNEGYTYSSWAPANCPETASCRDLAVLLTRVGASFKVELIRQTSGAVRSKTIGTGAPFYFSWSSDARSMAWHRNNRLLSYFEVESGQTHDSNLAPLLFQAPAWSPIDDRVMVTIVDDATARTTSLVLVNESGQVTTLRDGLQAVANFSWSPDGRFVAYRLLTRTGLTAVQVLDAQSGEVIANSQDVNVVAFFWAPDSKQIAYLTPDLRGGIDAPGYQAIQNQTQPVVLTWNVLDLERDQTRQLNRFIPTQPMLYLLSYFDQFSQSHQLWSPDSRYLVFGELAQGERVPTISILDTQSDGDAVTALGAGELGIWSYR
jgi:TolB protein